MYEQYKYYNDVEIRILDEKYLVSGINTKGLPGKNCEAHLSSLAITPPGCVVKGSMNVGSTGSVSLLDYKNTLFDKLVEFQRNIMSKDKDGSIKSEMCPPIDITIKCFTGEQTYHGRITEWSLSFSGGTPTVDLTWKSITQSNPKKDRLSGKYSKPSSFLAMAKDKFSEGADVKFVFENGESDTEDIDGNLQFIDENFYFDLTRINSCGNFLIDCYNLLTSNLKAKSGEQVEGLLDEYDNSIYRVRLKDPNKRSKKTPNSEVSSKLIFIQNGRYPEYKDIGSPGKESYVIPMTSFSFNMNNQKAALMTDIVGNINGNLVITPSGTSQSSGDLVRSYESVVSETKDITNASNTEIEFECYNVMSFERNNKGARIKFKVYNEFGEEHPVSGEATVSEVEYDLSGAVVKARVKATKVFNESKNESDPAQEKVSIDDNQSESDQTSNSTK